MYLSQHWLQVQSTAEQVEEALDVLVLQSSQMNQNAKAMRGALKEQTKMTEDVNS